MQASNTHVNTDPNMHAHTHTHVSVHKHQPVGVWAATPPDLTPLPSPVPTNQLVVFKLLGINALGIEDVAILLHHTYQLGPIVVEISAAV